MQKIFKTQFPTDEAILTDIRKGGRFIQFQYTNVLPLGGGIGIGFMPTDIYYIPSDKKALRYGWPTEVVESSLGIRDRANWLSSEKCYRSSFKRT